MKTPNKPWLLLLATVLLTLAPASASAETLAVSRVDQRFTDSNGNVLGDNWCWAACSKMVLDYYGHPETLPTIVAYGVGDATYDTWNYLWGSGTESRTGVRVWEVRAPSTIFIRRTKTITLSWKGIDEIVKHFSTGEVQTQTYSRTLTATEITDEIDTNDAPFVVRIGWNAGGGHFIVCYGTASGTHSIHDPWYGSYLISDTSLRTGTQITSGGDTHTWTHTLTTSKLLDLLFLFDTTASMFDDIDDARARANELLDKVADKFKNYRVAVANYKDFPEDPYGESDDYVYQADLAFTTDKAAAQSAINGLDVSGGNDFPESVYSALSRAIAGTGIGAWRPNPVRRIIVLIGDAPGHDPEPWAGGTSFNAVLTAATDPAAPIAVHCLLVGSNIDTASQFSLIAGGSGGSVTQADDASQVGLGLQAIVDSVAESPRFPRGLTGGIYPTFSFDPVGAAGMGSPATGLSIEVQKYNVARDAWSRLRVITLADENATVYTSTLPYAVGKFRWRLGFKRPGGKLFLPATDEVVKTAAKTVYEAEYSEFERVLSPPSDVTLLSPERNFTPTGPAVEYTFGSVPGATSYAVEIFEGARLWKKVKVRPSKTDPDASALTVTVKGHDPAESYSWRVQGLNFDRPKVDPSAW